MLAWEVSCDALGKYITLLVDRVTHLESTISTLPTRSTLIVINYSGKVTEVHAGTAEFPRALAVQTAKLESELEAVRSAVAYQTRRFANWTPAV